MKTPKMNKKKIQSEGAMSTTTILHELPFDIVIEIISRLPVKPLFRFKCVCKSWLSFISDNPQFAKLHLHYAKQDTSVNRYRFFLSTFPYKSIDQVAFCNCDNNVSREVRISRIPVQPFDFTFIGSCNGLIAFLFCVEPNSLQYCIVLNPTTGDFRELPPIDPSKDYYDFLGFGYDSLIDDYKLVRGNIAVSSTSGSVIKIDVFNLKANQWRSSQDVHTNFSLSEYYTSTNGILHWLVDMQEGSHTKLGIVSFDLGEQKFVEMVPVPLPDNITKKKSGIRIQGVGDDVWVCTWSDWHARYFKGWIMKRNGREISWRKLYSFSRERSPVFHDFRDEVVLWVAENGNVILDSDAGYELLLYNPEEENSLKYDLKNQEYQAMTYMETLISPNAT